MTYFRIGENDTLSTEGLIAIVAVLVVLAIAVWALYFFIKNKDNSKPLHTAKVKILEKASQQGNIEWYVVEFENGKRKKLRNFHASTVLIAAGDEGIMEYKGITIQSFRALSKNK